MTCKEAHLLVNSDDSGVFSASCSEVSMSADPKFLFQDYPQLTRAQRESVRDALCAARKGTFLSPTVRKTIREIAPATGDVRRRPEQCVVAFKWLINEAATDVGIPLGRERAALLERFVTLFIEEMYAAEAEAAMDDADCRGKATSGFIPGGSRELPGAHP